MTAAAFAQLQVKTAYIDGELCGVRSDGVTVEAGPGKQIHLPFLNPRRHAVAVELDLVDPLQAGRRFRGELGKLWFDPVRERHVCP
jgi:hypothetical protein